MSNVLFYGDVHAGHRNVTKFRSMFRDEQDHFEHLEREYHKVVTKRDKCIFTGDAVFSEERLKQIAKWQGQKVLILGNHDTEHLNIHQLTSVFNECHGILKYKEFWITHAPMHPDELRGRVNIHGHVHNQTINDIRYFNTSVDNIDFKPISLLEIRNIIQQRMNYYEIGRINTDHFNLIPAGLK